MKKRYWLISVLAGMALLQVERVQAGKLSDAFSGDGLGEITDIGNGEFDILAAGGFSGNRADTYAKWDRTAKAACNGGKYKVIKRDWQSAEYPGLLGGTIKCANKK